MAKATFTWIKRLIAATTTLRAAAAPTASYVASDYVESQWFDTVSLMISYTKGDTTSIEIRPEYSNNGDATSPNWHVGVKGVSVSTSASLTTATNTRRDYTYTHGGALTTDIDYIVIELPIRTNWFRLQVKVTGALTNSPSVTVIAFFLKSATSMERYNIF